MSASRTTAPGKAGAAPGARGRQVRRIAVLAAPSDGAAPATTEVFRQCLRAVAGLGPDAVVVLASAGADSARLRTSTTADLRTTGLAPLPVVFPVTSPPRNGAIPPLVIRAGNARLVLPVPSEVLTGAPPSPLLLNVLRRPRPRGETTVLLCYGQVASPDELKWADDFRNSIPKNSIIFVRCPLGPAWRRFQSTDVFFAPPMDGDARDSQSGTPGACWLTADGGAPLVRFLRLDGVAPPETLAWELIEVEQKITFGIQATPIAPPERTTTIRLRNPASHTLDFNAEWRFAREGVRVTPDVLGFRLAPGGTFQQTFHLQPPAGLPLRYAAPEFVVHTAIPPASGRQRRITASVRPWCVLSGTAEALETPPVLDGAPEEWDTAWRSLALPDQVTSGAPSWSGPDDASAEWTCGWWKDRLYVAGRVRDDHLVTTGPASDQAVLYLHPFEDTDSPPLRITLSADSSFRIAGNVRAPKESIQCRIKPGKQGFTFEVAIPFAALGLQSVPDRFRMDLAMRDVDPGQSPTLLFFSGNSEDEQSARLMAVFTCEREQEQEAPAEESSPEP